jgi:hypothetical protein
VLHLTLRSAIERMRGNAHRPALTSQVSGKPHSFETQRRHLVG